MENNTRRVMLTNVRLAFPCLNEPESFDGSGKPRFSATGLFEPGSENHKKCQAAMRAAAAEKWGENKADAAVKALTANLKVALQNGDTKAEWEGFEGNMFVGANAQASAPPTLLDGQRKALPRDTAMIYAGCYVNMSVEFWAQDNQYGKRINASLRGVQFYKDGDSFGAGAPASTDEFGVVEGVEETASDEDFA